MIEALRALARRGLPRLGLERIHHPSFVDLMLHERIGTVLDVGGDEDHFGVELRERGYKGRIVSFEPIEAVCRRLNARAAGDPLWDACRVGVGDAEGELEISVAAAPVFSSFKPATAYTSGKFIGAREERREKVPVVRLDCFLDQHPDYLSDCYLKIDAQGFEKEALAGAGPLPLPVHGHPARASAPPSLRRSRHGGGNGAVDGRPELRDRDGEREWLRLGRRSPARTGRRLRPQVWLTR